MSVPTNCISCGMQLYTNPPITDIKCDKCEEVDDLKLLIKRLKEKHEAELQQEKETVKQYKQVLQEIVSYSKYEGNQWYERAKRLLHNEDDL